MLDLHGRVRDFRMREPAGSGSRSDKAGGLILMAELLVVLAEIFGHFIIGAVDEVWALFYSPQRTQDRDRALLWVANRTRGTHIRGRPHRHAAVRWTVEGTEAVLYIPENYDGGKALGVNLRLKRPCSFRLRVRPEGAWDKVRKFFGAQDVQLGDALFDPKFIVEANQVARARSLLTRDVRSRMVRLLRHGSLAVEFGPAGISLHTSEAFQDRVQDLSEYAIEALELCTALIRILDPSMVVAEDVEIGGGACPVCGTAVVESPGQCKRCGTPHHAECWDYLGGCAVYACAARPRKLVAARPRGHG